MYATADVHMFIISRAFGAFYTSVCSKSQQLSYYPTKETTKQTTQPFLAGISVWQLP